MKKLFFFLAAMLVTLAVSATPIEPGANALSAAITAADAGATIELATGTFTESSSFAINKNLIIKAADGATPIVRLATAAYIKVSNGASVIIKGLTFDGATNSTETAIRAYDATATKIRIEDCEFYGFVKNIITGSESTHADSVFVNNCYFHDNTGRAAIYFAASNVENQQSCLSLQVTNSTFANNSIPSYDVGLIDIRNRDAAVEANQKLRVDNCTFYNNTTKNFDYADVKSYKSTDVIVSNSIFFGPSSTYDGRATHLYGGQIKNCLTINYVHETAGHRTGGATFNDTILNKDPKFIADSIAKGKYNLAEDSPAKAAGVGGTHLGDPRWWPASWQPAEIIPVASVALDKSEISIEVNEAEFLTATISPSEATDKTVSWSSSDDAIAKVSDGLVTGVAAGMATITVTASGKTATCEVTVTAATIPEVKLTSTYTLAAKVAHLEGKVWKMYEDEKYKIYGDGDNNEKYGNALWTINVTNPCIISASVMDLGGGALYELDVFQGEDSITTVIQPESSQWWSGVVDMTGTMTLSKAGEYTFRLRNTLGWSSGKTSGIMLTYEEDAPRTLYCYVDKSWWTDGGAKVKCYAKIDGGEEYAAWPGAVMEEIDDNLWKVVIPGKYNRINFVRANPTNEGNAYWGAKTDEMAVPTNSNLFTITSDEAQWDDAGKTAQGKWSVKDAKYYIAGNMTNWGEDPIGALADEQVLKLAAGKYQIKVVGKAWYGMNKLTAVSKGLYPDQDGNICFTLAEAGDVTINFVEGDEITTFTVTGAFALPSVKLIGAGDAFGKWKEDDAVAFTTDDGDLSASHTFTLAEGEYEFKMIREGEWLTLEGEDGEHHKKSYDMHRTWTTASGFYRDSEYYPLKLIADMDGNYKFTWTYATGELVITFPAEIPSAIDNANANAKAVKSIVNGQLIITRDGKTYNVLGTIVK